MVDVRSFIPLGESVFVRTHEMCNELYVNISEYTVYANYKLYPMGVTLTESEFKDLLEAIQMDVCYLDGVLRITRTGKGVKIIKREGSIYLKRDQVTTLLDSRDNILGR